MCSSWVQRRVTTYERGWELSTLVGDTNYLRQRPKQPLGRLRPGYEVVAHNKEALIDVPVRIFT